MTETVSRHPFGMPPGSVRGLLALMISGLFVTLILLPASQVVEIPMFLYPLLSLLLVFAVAHGHSIGNSELGHPLHLPRGVLRLLLSGGLIAAVIWKYTSDPDTLMLCLQPTVKQLSQWPALMFALFGGFLIGRIIRMGPWKNTAMYQDLLAWLSLICMIGLAVVTLLVVFVHPTLPEGLNLEVLEAVLTSAVALYFGARS